LKGLTALIAARTALPTVLFRAVEATEGRLRANTSLSTEIDTTKHQS